MLTCAPLSHSGAALGLPALLRGGTLLVMPGFEPVAVMQAIARRAVLSFPWLRDLQIIRAWAALRVMPPDGLPIYDQSERFPGAFTANCHSGVTLAGAHANLFAPMVAAGMLDPELELLPPPSDGTGHAVVHW